MHSVEARGSTTDRGAGSGIVLAGSQLVVERANGRSAAGAVAL
jgi:hypothetical protein